MDIKSELKYGFWMAFALFIWWVVEYMLGWQIPDTDLNFYSSIYSNLIVSVVGLFLVMLVKKQQLPSGEVKYGTLAISGGIALLAAGILLIPLASIFFHFINQDWVELGVEKALEKLDENATKEEIVKMTERAESYYAPSSMGMTSFSKLIMMGFFLVLAEALIVLKLPIGTGSK